MTERDNQSSGASFIVEFEAGELEFGKASAKVWDRYLDKLKRGESAAGWKELAFACCLSGDAEKVQAALDMEPAALPDIAEEIEAISGGEIEPEVKGREVHCAGLAFACPNSRQWATYQENLRSDQLRGGEASRILLDDLVSDKQALAALLGSEPAVIGGIMLEVSKLAGRGIRIKRKKS